MDESYCGISYYFCSLLCQAALSIAITNLLVCFCSFDFSCPVLEKDNFVKHLCIVLSYYYYYFFNLVCFDLCFIVYTVYYLCSASGWRRKFISLNEKMKHFDRLHPSASVRVNPRVLHLRLSVRTLTNPSSTTSHHRYRYCVSVV